MKRFTLTLLAVTLITAFSCSLAENRPTEQNNDKSVNTTATAKQQKVRLHTTEGDIIVVLYNETPKHRDNFLKLVADHYYDSVLFHRVIKNFMVQTGDGSSRNASPGQLLGAGDLNYTIPAEFVYPRYFHKRGALAAARTADQVNPERASSGSQFYIVTGKVYSSGELKQMESQMANMKKREIMQGLARQYRDSIKAMQRRGDRDALAALQSGLAQLAEKEYAKAPFRLTDEQLDAYTTIGGTPHLDGQYTVFGEVVDGLDVVDRIQNAETNANDRPVKDIRIISATLLE